MTTLFPNAWHVARREYLQRVRNRTFVISTILLAVVAAGVILLPTGLRLIGLDEPPRVAVHVAADDVSTDPVLALTAIISADQEGGEAASVDRVDDPDAARDEVAGGDLDALLIVDRATDGELAFELVSDAGQTSRTRVAIEQAASAVAISDRLERAGISPAEGGELFAPPDLTITATEPDDRTPEEFGSAFLIAYAIVILTFIAVLTYGQWVAQSVAEEKSSRVMELLITAATPKQLLAGKIMGSGGAGLTQYLVVIAAVAVSFFASGPIERALGTGEGEGFVLTGVDAPMVVVFVLFFIGGFMLYATLYAAAGSMVSRLEDVQQAAGPLMVIAMIGYFASFAGLNVPDAGWVAVMSIVPFFSAYLMPARMVLTNVSPIEVLAALGLLFVTVLAAVWVASRIYSAGVLLYGQRPGLRSVLRAARVAR